MDLRRPTLAILCAGIGAPGINGIISSATIEAINQGLDVIGIFDGFSQLKRGHADIISLDLSNTTRIFDKGGSIIRASREQLYNSIDADNAVRVLQFHRVRYL